MSTYQNKKTSNAARGALVSLCVSIGMVFVGEAMVEDASYSAHTTYYSYNPTATTRTSASTTTAGTSASSASSTAASKTTASSSTTASSAASVQEKADPREANYTGTTTDYQQIKLTWTQEDGGTAWISFSLDKNVYEYYSKLARYYDLDDYKDKYIYDAYSQELLGHMVNGLRAAQESAGWSEYRLIQETTNMVQQCIAYQTDSEGEGVSEYPKYPIETVYERKGDCEDTAMLLAGLIRKLGYSSCLLDYPGHMAAGIYGKDNVTGTYYLYEDHKFFYIESTEGGDIGEMPSGFDTTLTGIYPLY